MSGNADNETISGVEGELRSYGISVETLERTDEGMKFEYMTAFPGDTVNHREMGRACNALIDLAEADEWTPETVEATVLRIDDDEMGTWRIDPEWIIQLIDGGLTETEFSTRVLDSLEGR